MEDRIGVNTSDADESEPLLGSNSNSLSVITRSHHKSVLVNLFFLFLVIIGQSGQNVTLPMWIDADIHPHEKSAKNATHKHKQDEFPPFTDHYFFLFLPAFIYALIFGIAHWINTILNRGFQHYRRRVSHRHLIPAGFMFGLSAVFIVFAASGERTAPYLQSILANIAIPATLIIRKIPTTRKLVCALATVLTLVVCLLPSIIPKLDPKPHKDQGGADGRKGVFWALCFMLGFVFSAIANILQERALTAGMESSHKPPDLAHAICWMEIYQFVFLVLCFWVDAIPGFGSAKSIKHVGINWWHGLQCFFGGDGCSYTSGLLGTLFISLFAIYTIGANYLLSGEGATYLVIVQSVVTPLGFLFWTLFKEQPHFHWGPAVTITTWLNIAGLVVMVPSIYFYNTGAPERTAKRKDKPLRPAYNT